MSAARSLISFSRLPSVAGLLVALRWLYVLGQGCILWLATGWLGLHLPVAEILVCLVLVVAGNGLASYRWWQLGAGPTANVVGRQKSNAVNKQEASAVELTAWLCFDIVMLTALLYFTGGSTNPFVSLYLLPIALAVIVLPSRWAVGFTLLAAVSYTLLLFWHQPMHAMHTNFNLHVNGMWLNFLLTATLLLLVVTVLVQRLRQRDAALAMAREQTLRDQQIVELGTVAAGTAHELGTPLTTLGMLLDDLPANDTTELMAVQIQRCQEQLRQLLSMQQAKAESDVSLTLTAYLQDLVEHWAVTSPKIQLHVSVNNELTAVSIRPLLKVTQTLRSLLDNAADASLANGRDEVGFTARLALKNQLVVTIYDQGEVLSTKALQTIQTLHRDPLAASKLSNQSSATRKSHGNGVGLLLAYTVLNNLGGTLKFAHAHQAISGNDDTKWSTQVKVTLPLSALTIREHQLG